MPSASATIAYSAIMDDALIVLGEAGESLINSTLYQVKNFLESYIATSVLPVIVDKHAYRAGEAFPDSYRRHLRFMISLARIEVTVDAGAINFYVNLGDMLGNDADYEKGFHDHALIDTGVPMEMRKKKSGFVRHPQQVQLPYGGEPLLSDQEKRQEFWETAVIDQDVYWANIVRGRGNNKSMTGFTAPTFETIAQRRVSAWESLGVAPEWHVLEYGTASSQPYYGGGYFIGSIELAITCVATRYMENAITQAVRLAEQQARLTAAKFKTGARLQVRSITSGRYQATEPLVYNGNQGISNIDIWACTDI
jgi:hypothetical protein